MKVWIMKYAMSSGVQLAEVEDVGNGMVKLKQRYPSYFHGLGREWCDSEESARARFEELKAAKIKSLEKSIAKVRKAEFKAGDGKGGEA